MVNGPRKLSKEWIKLVSNFFLNEYIAAEKKFGRFNISTKKLSILLYLRHKEYITHKTMREVFNDMVEENVKENKNDLRPDK